MSLIGDLLLTLMLNFLLKSHPEISFGLVVKFLLSLNTLCTY